MKYPGQVSNTDSVLAMKQVLDECLHVDSSQLYDKLLDHSFPCSLPKKKYLTVLLHIGIVEVDVKHNGKVLPVIAFIGFRF